MINELIFIILFCAMIVFLFITLHYKNEAFGAFTIIILIILASQLFPVVGGIQYHTGAVINSSDENNIIISDTFDVYSNSYLGLTLMLVVLYLSMQIIVFRKDKKREVEENNHI
jgi:hypothetical protein